MVGDDILTRPRPSYKCEMCVNKQSVRIRRQRDRPGGQKGLTSPADGLG